MYDSFARVVFYYIFVSQYSNFKETNCFENFMNLELADWCGAKIPELYPSWRRNAQFQTFIARWLKPRVS